jgi:hypothetical protein
MPTMGSSGTTSACWVTWTNSTTASTTLVWNGWNSTAWNSTAFLTTQAPPPPPTPEEIAAQEEYRQRAREAAKREAEERAAAIAKAQALLEGMLTPEQIAQLAAHHWFEVISQHGHRYRINQGQRRNVQRLKKDGAHEAWFCIHPDDVPDEDAMLAQKLLLETDERAFLRIANRS